MKKILLPIIFITLLSNLLFPQNPGGLSKPTKLPPSLIKKIIDSSKTGQNIKKNPKSGKITLLPLIKIIFPIDSLITTSNSVIRIVADIQNILTEKDATLKKNKQDKIPLISKSEIQDGLRIIWQVDLSDGENDFEITAFNSNGEFITINRTVKYIEFKESAVKPTIHAVLVGVSKYQDSSFKDLNFAHRDAESFFNFLKENYERISSDNISLLTNENASNDMVIKNIKDISQNTEPNDMLLVYFAGHGMISEGNRIYFICNNTRFDNIDGTALSDYQIRNVINDYCKANKKIIIFDACNSGKVTDETMINITEEPSLNIKLENKNLSGPVKMETRGKNHYPQFYLNLASKSGYITISASKGDEYSYEFDRPGGGNGVFTYYLIEGLKGKADENKDKIVTVEEAYDYVKNMVRKATKGKQRPELKGNYDSDIPLSFIK